MSDERHQTDTAEKRKSRKKAKALERIAAEKNSSTQRHQTDSAERRAAEKLAKE